MGIAAGIFSQNGSACSEELEVSSSLVAKTFQRSPTGFMLDYMSSSWGFQRRNICDHAELLEHLELSRTSTPGPRRTQIYSIASKFSPSPLGITSTAMRDLLTAFNVNVAFVQVLSAFGEKPRRSEAALDCFVLHQDAGHLGSFELMYLFRFVELDPGVDSEWAFRQLGVYHRHCTDKNEDVFILLQPHQCSQLDGRLEDLQYSISDATEFASCPVKFHEILFRTYTSSGWRPYMKQVSEDFVTSSDSAFTMNIETEDYVRYQTLRHWRDLADRIAPVPAMIGSLDRILVGLSQLGQQDQSAAAKTLVPFVQSHRSLLGGLRESAGVLQNRVDGLIGFLTDTIQIKSQYEAAKLNTHMSSLTQDTVDDSANVRIITFLSMLYLPASLIASLFGMDFFNFDSNSNQMIISRDFWIFVVVVIPLTLFTVGGWYSLSRHSRKLRKTKTNVGSITLGVRGR